MRAGKPVVVHGDGTIAVDADPRDDFAVAFVGLFGHPAAIGEDFTITGTHAPTWNQIYTWLGQAAGVEPELVHVASETIALVAPELGPGPGRRQGALDGVRLQQGVGAGAGVRARPSPTHDAARRADRLVRRESRRSSRSTPSWTRSSTGWSRVREPSERRVDDHVRLTAHRRVARLGARRGAFPQCR